MAATPAACVRLSAWAIQRRAIVAVHAPMQDRRSAAAVKPAPFAYHAVHELDEALVLLAEHGEDAAVIAGGQSLVPLLALRMARFDHLVDINGIAALAGIE